MQESLTFQRWLKRLRAEQDLTQEMLAQAVGCATHTIRTFERGTRRPSRGMAERLAHVLAIPSEQRAEFVRLARAPVLQTPALPASADRALLERATRPAAAPPGGQADPAVLATKLYAPQPRAERVSRPRLLAGCTIAVLVAASRPWC
ncbi:MAG TPA: helix-turn-helix domain-containing protein [Chloroflexaceae bacterium]|nr:helix-turn-helix domain-containing protein [Chloroflexaceae bacterium]